MIRRLTFQSFNYFPVENHNIVEQISASISDSGVAEGGDLGGHRPPTGENSELGVNYFLFTEKLLLR